MKIRNKEQTQSSKIETILKMAISASLGSLGIVLSIVVVIVPNFEFISVTIYLVSILFGVNYGLLTAISTTLVFEFVATALVGPASYLIVFKLACYVILALIAGIARKGFLKLSFWELGVFGSLFALFYDLVVTFGFQVVLIPDQSFAYYLDLLILGVPFTISHVISSFVLFSLSITVINWIMSAFQVRGIKQLMLPSFTRNDESKENLNRKNR
ncbi:MAG: hypothetical protein GOP50_04395 [Candidatus Heimdallarchaeota archaeon]|nr:hypothetical protein [Candidatus Heimdallarchaeota archaeon]